MSRELVERFKTEPEAAYRALLEEYTPVVLRMIRRFMQDADEVMEVYTHICERLSANDYRALRHFDINGELTPWLSVVVANACRDRFRKQKATSVPESVISQLDERERYVFTYHFQEHLPHEDISEIISRRHRVPCTALEVVRAIAKINDLLSTRKRWHLLCALNANRPMLSLDELREVGIQPSVESEADSFEEALLHKELVDRLNAALKQLEPDDQLLVLLRYEHERTAPQIAQLMQFDDYKYVYTRLRTVVNRLRRMMNRDAGSEG